MSLLDKLPPLLATKAATELNESPAHYPSCFAALRNWLQLQPHFRSRTSDEFLLAFLRTAKFSVERAKQRIESFYRYRSELPELFANWNIFEQKFGDIIISGALIYLPEPAALDGPRVIIIRPKCFDLTRHSSLDVYRTLFIAVDLLLYEDVQVQIAGFLIILDLGNVTRDVMLDFKPRLARNIIDGLNKHIFPARFKGMHLVNMPTMIERLYNLVKGAISSKMRDRFVIHGQSLEKLDAYMPRRILPEEYGGTYNIIENQVNLLNKLRSKAHVLDEEQNYGMVEAYVKAQKPVSSSDLGVSGTFKTLVID
ncbi:alpha-tocopherol transfer protein-like [Scaptodrosophila lebanonensis]|uniref:Alpha-tocopherol transfer protein-like n=1 Tax=Drosophila lebanonensis TaxID=7225 RepID=A0A6J2UJQ8_DROLE|nr:alpha-tocopherol transfer protein-like [Scaptodrosophila lebanonensis]